MYDTQGKVQAITNKFWNINKRLVVWNTSHIIR
jgi:hypothetical protein